MALLQVRQVNKRFGGLMALSNVDLTIEAGTIISIIGPNGAGKTTFFNCITGIYRPDDGDIVFNGQSVVGKRPDQITALGVARTFQNIRLFGAMTVLENVLVGMHTHIRARLWDILGHSAEFRREDRAVRKRAQEILEYVGLQELGDELAKNLPYGAQRRVEVARALATQRTNGRYESPGIVGRDRPISAAARRPGDHRSADRTSNARGHGHLGAHHRA